MDNQDEFPFAIDDADATPTCVEHTPADLLSLLEHARPLRRRSVDPPLPLDAALDDSTDAVAHRGAARAASVDGDDDVHAASDAVTLGAALRALAELDVAARAQFAS